MSPLLQREQSDFLPSCLRLLEPCTRFTRKQRGRAGVVVVSHEGNLVFLEEPAVSHCSPCPLAISALLLPRPSDPNRRTDALHCHALSRTGQSQAESDFFPLSAFGRSKKARTDKSVFVFSESKVAEKRKKNRGHLERAMRRETGDGRRETDQSTRTNMNCTRPGPRRGLVECRK